MVKPIQVMDSSTCIERRASSSSIHEIQTHNRSFNTNGRNRTCSCDRLFFDNDQTISTDNTTTNSQHQLGNLNNNNNRMNCNNNSCDRFYYDHHVITDKKGKKNSTNSIIDDLERKSFWHNCGAEGVPLIVTKTPKYQQKHRC
jgi:hypothetical protein